MPSSNAALLAASYQAAQKELASKTTEIVLALWLSQMGESKDLRASANEWLRLAIPVILGGRRASIKLGQGFFQGYRRLELPNEPSMRMPAVPELDTKALTTSLWVTGPQQYVDAGKAVDDIFDEERINAITGAATRHIMNGGREAIDSAYEADVKTTGYYRIEDGDPCYFCAMLMSRGVVFKGDSFEESDIRFFGPGDAKVHDHCGGSLVAAYDKDPYPGPTKDANDLWLSQPPVPPGVDPVKHWRQFYEGRQQPAAA